MRLFCLFIILSLGSISAQTFIGKINPFPENNILKVSTRDTLHILAVLADFQEDKDASTYGNGKFGSMYSKDYGTSILDPLPHDDAYFSSHLEFAQNYFKKVSKNKVNIAYSFIPGIITVSQTMRNYSPPNNSSDLSLLGNFAKEVWQNVAAQNPSINFNNYEIFLIFHAGVGRDVSIPGSFGNEKDLPSVFLSDKALKNIFGSDLSGLPQNSDGMFNTMLIPETESRELSGLGGTALIQLTINGLIVSSIGSYLGLPDLFDTKTGLSAIGRFGLMDGQAIFAYSGTFPPEPSAWEKIYLGWEKPVDSGIKNKTINLFADLASSLTDTVILKVPINSTEYFLVENRIRDVNKDGSKINLVVGNEKLTKVFPKDTTGFYSYSTDSLYGVITNVDEFDWALPGNGIVIWHIDDNVINAKLAENEINTDKFHRGVDVEEADGVQDIGETFTTIFGDQVVGEGTDLDFWYKGNKAVLYQNKFTKDTQPNTDSYSGANSLISFTNFSSIGNEMSFNLSFGDSLVQPLIKRQLDQPYQIKVSETSEEQRFYAASNSCILILNDNGSVVDSIPINIADNFKTAAVTINSTNYFVIATSVDVSKQGTVIVLTDNGNSRTLYNHSIPFSVSSGPYLRILNDGSYEILLGTNDGIVVFYSLNGLINSETPQPMDSLILDSFYKVTKIAVTKDFYSLLLKDTRENINAGNALYESGGTIFPLPVENWSIALSQDKLGNFISVVSNSKNECYLVQNGNKLASFSLLNTNGFSMGDIKRDGNNYLTANKNNSVNVINLTGSSGDNFPFSDPLNLGFEGIPLIADFSGNNNADIISYTIDGRIFALDGSSGKVLNEFPISVGEQLNSTPVFFNDNGRASLLVLTKTNILYAWNIGSSIGNEYWISENADNMNSSFVGEASSINLINSFFPKERAYNWPNPVYNDFTNIRYYVSEDSKINIKIFDLAGDFITEINDFARGGFDKETVWNVKDIQSGIYLARIEAAGSSGKVEKNIIKIAVIK